MKKLLTYSIVIATIVWSMGLAAVVPMATAAYTATAGDLIKTATNPAVYYIDADGERHLFVNAPTFWSWYGGSWSNITFGNTVKTIQTLSQADFDDLTEGDHVTMRPGSLVKFTNSPRVYAASTGAVLHKLADEAAAVALFGADWLADANKVQPGFATDYDTTGAVLTADSSYSEGALVKWEGSSDIYYIEDGLKRLVTTEAFLANGFKDSNVQTAPATIAFEAGSSITAEESVLTTVAGTGSSGAVVSGSSLSVALANDTPASGLAIYAAIRIPFTTVSMTASADGDITVDTLVVERKGASADANFSTVAIIDADTNVQIGVNQSLNSSSKATFSNDFVVKAGTTRKILLAGNMASSGAGQIPQLALSALTLKSGATVVGTLPITGNPQTMTSMTIGAIAVVRGTYMTSTSTEIKVGVTDQIVGAFKITTDSTEGQRIKQIKFYNNGTAALDSDIGNYKLLVDNITPVTATFTKDGKYLTADFTDNSVLIEKGKSKEFVLQAEILGGSTRTIIMSIYRNTDILASGDTYGYMATPTYSGTGLGSTTALVMTNDQLTISAGTLRIESSSAVPAQDIAFGDDQELGAFNFVVAGEPVTITALTLAISSTTLDSTEMDNWKLVEGEETLWGPNTPTISTGVAYTSSVTLGVGTHAVKVVADIKSTGRFAANETFYFKITGSTVTATGQTTDDTVTISPTGAVNSNTMTFKTAKLSITANSLPVDGTATLGAKKFLYGSWNFNASGSGEDVKITAITLGNQLATTTNLDSVSLYDVTNKDNCTTKYPSATLDSYGCLLQVKDGYHDSSTWTLTNPIIVTKNTSLNLELRADVRTTAATYQGHKDEFIIKNDGTIVPVTAVGTVTSNTVTPTGSGYNASDGADITIGGAGTLTVNISDSQPSSKLLAEGQTYEIGRLKLTATNEPIKVSDLSVCIGAGSLGGTGTGDSGDVSNIKVYKATDMTTPLIDSSINGDCEAFSLPQDSLTVPIGSAGIDLVIKSTTAKVDNSSIDESGTANVSFKLGIGGTDGITAKGVNSGLSAGETVTAASSSAMILHKGYPTITVNDPATKLVSGAVLYDVTVNNPTDSTVAIYKLSFVTSTSSGDLGISLGGLQAKLPAWSSFKQISDDHATTTSNGLISAQGTLWNFYMFDPDSTTKTQTPLKISAGSNARFQFIGRTITGLDGTTGESIEVQMLGDNATTSGETTGELAAILAVATTSSALRATADLNIGVYSDNHNQNGNFIWSDLWSNEGTQTTATAQWFNGYLVDGLAVTSTVKSIPE